MNAQRVTDSVAEPKNILRSDVAMGDPLSMKRGDRLDQGTKGEESFKRTPTEEVRVLRERPQREIFRDEPAS